MASYFSGIDPRELTTVYPPSMDPGFLAREAGIGVGNNAVALPGEAVRAAESIWKSVSSPLDTIGAIAGGIGGLALGFKDWITSPIPSHTLEKQFDKVATASAQELGGMAFDAATGLITAYIGGRAVEWVGGKWVSAKGTTGTPVTKGPCCFAAGTKVSTPQGDRVIESLKVGDVVWSKPEKGGKPFAAAILATHQRSDQPIYRLKLKVFVALAQRKAKPCWLRRATPSMYPPNVTSFLSKIWNRVICCSHWLMATPKTPRPKSNR